MPDIIIIAGIIFSIVFSAIGFLDDTISLAIVFVPIFILLTIWFTLSVVNLERDIEYFNLYQTEQENVVIQYYIDNNKNLKNIDKIYTDYKEREAKVTYGEPFSLGIVYIFSVDKIEVIKKRI